jgi:putative nucleotidyltransferase with HDIG domain
MRERAEAIVRQLQGKGHVAYFAGGCVRDAIRGEAPSDYDVATSAKPEEIVAQFERTREVGAHFGVVLVIEGGHEFEIATFRSDGSYGDGRRPDSVEFSNPEEDAKRRDFTINGLFYDPVEDKLIDLIDGERDLSTGLIRAIGNPAARLAEDHLRLLRAVRFAARFGFEIEPQTWTAVCAGAGDLSKISAERVRDEFSKIMLDGNRVRGFDLLVESGLMAQVIPEILDLKGCEQPPQFHPEGDVFVHTRLMLSLLEGEPSLVVVLGVLLHDIAKPATYTYDEVDQRIRFNGHDKLGATMAETILRRLKYPNGVIDAVVTLVDNHMTFKDVQKMRTAKLKRFMARETFSDEMELHRVDCLGSWGGLDNYDFLNSKTEEFANEPINPPPLVNGRDLMKLGWPPGPGLGKILTEIQDRQLEGALTTREEALQWLADEGKPPIS